MLIEDNEGDILLFREALEDISADLHLDIFRDGELASHHFNTLHSSADITNIPDLIVLDINLPKVDGHDLLVQIRNTESLTTVPVIVLTTSSLEKDIFRAYENNANCFITKPSELDQLFYVIGSIHKFWLKGDNMTLS